MHDHHDEDTLGPPPRSPSAARKHLRRAIAGAAALALSLVLTAPPTAARADSVAIPAHIDLVVTGDPASPAFVREQIEAAVTRALAPRLPPQARIAVRAILPAPQPLDRGFETTFTALVAVDAGDGSAPATGAVGVGVDDADLADFSPLTLAFRDDPERIVADGVLSRTIVAAGTPARIYYYHQNRAATRRFCVVLAANGSVRTDVQIVGATAGPNIDVMSVGHAVTKTFLARKPHDEGRVVTIAGGRPILIRDTLVAPDDGIVGALDARVLYGGPVTVTVMAIPPGADPDRYLYAAALPPDGHARHGDFPLAGFGERVIAFTAGGPDATRVYGSRDQTLANADPGDAGRDYGDYGVLQRIAFDLDNPGDAPATVYLFEKPLGGDVRSSFVVNGSPIDLGCARLARPYLIAGYPLAPHATGTLDVLTMTDGGSNYPLEIGVTSTPPIPQTPPISAPDGCFPKAPAPAASAQPARRPAGH